MVGLVPSFATKIPSGDDRERAVCAHCGFIDYRNPKIVAGAVCIKEGRVLLCRRTIMPRAGYWTVPAGFMELGESVEDAAMREAREEACADIALDGLVGVYSVPHVGQVHMMFRARLLNDARAGDETSAVKMVAWGDIDWGELAFPTVEWALRDWYEGRDRPVGAPMVRSNPPAISLDDP